MPTSPVIVQCNNCDALKKAYNKVECTILDLIRNRFSNISYNTTLYYNRALMSRLVRYRRVIYNRLYNPHYPCKAIETQDIIKLAITHAYMGPDCSFCPQCFPAMEPTTTTTTTTQPPTTTTTSTSTTSTSTSTTTTTSTSSSTTTTTTTTEPTYRYCVGRHGNICYLACADASTCYYDYCLSYDPSDCEVACSGDLECTTTTTTTTTMLIT
jgi:hypothetical protein